MAIFSSFRFCVCCFCVHVLFSGCNEPKITTWDLLPASTVAVLENTPVQELKNQPLVTTEISRLAALDSLQAACTVAWIKIEKNRSEELFIVPEPIGLFERIKASYGSQVKHRKLNGYDFWEFGAKENGVYILQESNMLAISASSLVIESVIRTLTHKRPHHPLAQLKKLPNLRQDQGNLYVDWVSIPMEWPLAQQSILDVQHNEATLMLDGFTLPDTARFSWQLLKSMERQTPAALSLQDVVPQGAQAFLHLGFSDAGAWNEARLELMQQNKRAVFDSLQGQLKATGFSDDRFFSAIDRELGFITTDRGVVIVCRLKEITKVDSELKKIRASGADEESNLNFSEHGRLVHYLFWPFAPAFTSLHYTFDGDLLFLANTQAAVQLVLEKLALDQTWGKTLAWQKFHTAMLKEANVSYFLAHPVRDKLSETFFFASGWRGYGQFSNVDQQFYTSMLLQFNRQRAGSSGVAVAPAASNQATFDVAIQTKAYPVINHTTKEEEIVFVDATGQLCLVSQNKTLWSLPVGTPESDIYQVDFFKNRKLQYAFVAGQKLHIVDRLGRPISGYPVSLQKGAIRSMSVVDYDHTRNYRFLINYVKGNILMLDAKGKPLDGWSPREFGEEIFEVRFERMRGKDYFIAQGRRKLFLTNRKGELLPGFPVSGAEDVTPGIAADTDRGLLIVLTRSGKLQWIQLNGVVLQEKILPKHSVEARFHMLASADQFFVVRLDRGKVAMFSQGGDELFEVENPGSNRVQPQVAVWNQTAYLILHDAEQQLVHVFSPLGAAVLGRPLEASAEPSFSRANEQALHLFTVNGSQLATTVVR